VSFELAMGDSRFSLFPVGFPLFSPPLIHLWNDPVSASLAAMASTSSDDSATDGQPVLETVKYLRQYGAGKLQSEFKISSKQHSKHPNLWLFKYSQTQSDFSVRPCPTSHSLCLN